MVLESICSLIIMFAQNLDMGYWNLTLNHYNIHTALLRSIFSMSYECSKHVAPHGVSVISAWTVCPSLMREVLFS